MDEGGVVKGSSRMRFKRKWPSVAPRLNRFAAAGDGSPLVPVTARFPVELSARPRDRCGGSRMHLLTRSSLRQRGAGRAFTLPCWLTSVSVG